MTKKQKLTFKTLVTLCAITLSVSFSSAQTDISESHLLVHEAENLLVNTEVPSIEDFETAFQKLQRAITLEPDNYEALTLLGETKRRYAVIYYDSWKNFDAVENLLNEASESLKKAILIAPERPEAYKNYYYVLESLEGSFRGKRKKMPAALIKEKNNIEEKMFSLNSADSEIMYLKGYYLIDRGKAKEGKELVLKSLPGEGDILFETFHLKEQLASYLRKKGQLKEADELEERIKMEKKINDGLSDLSTGDVDEGLRIIEESTKGDYSKIPKGTRKLIIELLERRALKLEEQIEKKMERETGKEKIIENPGQVKAYVHELKDKVKREEQQGKSDDKGK